MKIPLSIHFSLDPGTTFDPAALTEEQYREVQESIEDFVFSWFGRSPSISSGSKLNKEYAVWLEVK